MNKKEINDNDFSIIHDVEQETQAKERKEKQSGMAISALVCGIISICSCGIIFIPEILGIVFACIAMKDKNRKQTMAKVGLILSIVSFALFFFLMIILGSGDSATKESTTEASTTQEETNVEVEATQEVTTEKKEKPKDKKDLYQYYGENVFDFQKETGMDMEKDGNTYYSGLVYLNTDNDDRIISIRGCRTKSN